MYGHAARDDSFGRRAAERERTAPVPRSHSLSEMRSRFSDRGKSDRSEQERAPFRVRIMTHATRATTVDAVTNETYRGYRLSILFLTREGASADNIRDNTSTYRRERLPMRRTERRHETFLCFSSVMDPPENHVMKISLARVIHLLTKLNVILHLYW